MCEQSWATLKERNAHYFGLSLAALQVFDQILYIGTSPMKAPRLAISG
jgi:hypothetical protein